MDDHLQAVLDQLEIGPQTQTLSDNARFSDEVIEFSREKLLQIELDPNLPLDVILFGSYARREASHTSDFDYLIVPHSLPQEEQVRSTREITHAVHELLKDLEATNNVDVGNMKPGASGIFGTIQSAIELVERIGLEQDTNTTHTRRSLLLQESVSIYRPDLHEQLLKTILARYMSDYPEYSKAGAPRFLLNDLNRYWFTVAVDYQAKRWERLDDGWGIRYLKLLITRRLSYVAGVLPLLLCNETNPATVDGLLAAYKRPALSRIADLAKLADFSCWDELRTIFLVANDFLASLNDEEQRETLGNIGGRPDTGEYPGFDALKIRAKELDDALRIIFSSDPLQELTNRYLIL